MSLARSSRSWIKTIAQMLQDLILSVASAVVLFRLGNMQLDGLLTFGGIVLGLLFGFTSLIFNRARAYPASPNQRRSLLAGELAFRATLSYTLGVVITAFIYFGLHGSGYQPTPLDSYPTQAVPAFLAFVPLLFFTVTIVTLSQSTRVLLKGMRGRIWARVFIKNTWSRQA